MRPLVVSIPDMCALLGCSRSLAYELINRPDGVTGVKIGRKTVVTLASIEAMLERNVIKPVAKPTDNGR